MAIKVKILERDFATGLPNIYYKIFFDATDFKVYFNENKKQTHLRIKRKKQDIAFFPSGGWLSVEIEKEK